MEGLPPGYGARPARPADLDPIVAVLHARDLLEVGHADSTRAFVEDAWRDPRVDVVTDTLVVESPAGQVVAYGDVTHVDEPYVTAWVQVHPDHLGRGIGRAMLAWVEGRAAQMPEHALHQVVDGGDRRGRHLLEAHGYHLVRTHLHMVGTLSELLPIVPTSDVHIRPMAHGDEMAIHGVLQEAFAEHFALTVEPFDRWWSQWEVDPLFDPSLFLVAEAGDAGAVGVACDFVDEGIGWIGDLGVRLAWRGRGIGRALLGASFDAFRARGLDSARLNVDAENETRAADLYRSVGMGEHRRYLVFEKPLGPGG